MKRSIDRILTTHVGSLVRPIELRRLIAQQEAGEAIDEIEFEVAIRDGVAAVVREQAQAGIDIPSDGEFGKRGWSTYVTSRLTGFEFRERRAGDAEPIVPQSAGRDGQKFRDFYAAYQTVQFYPWTSELGQTKPPKPGIVECTGPIEYRDAEVKRDIANFKDALRGLQFEEAFLPVAAPQSARGVRSNRYYRNDDDYLTAIAEALREEYRAIIDAVFLIQLDDAFLAHEYDRLLISQSEAEVHKGFEAYVELLNHVLRDIPSDKIRYHVCWGSWNVPHTSDVPLRNLLDLIFRVNAQAYSLEAANPRHEHEWQVWKDVKLPDGKILIPGMISHSTNVVEHPELIALRIKNFASLVGRENVIAGTDCGFSQSWNAVRVHPSVQWAKLQSLAEGAKLASRELW